MDFLSCLTPRAHAGNRALLTCPSPVCIPAAVHMGTRSGLQVMGIGDMQARMELDVFNGWMGWVFSLVDSGSFSLLPYRMMNVLFSVLPPGLPRP